MDATSPGPAGSRPSGSPRTVSSRPGSLRDTGRIRGIDVARAIAILGMVAVHFTLSDPAGAGGETAALPDGPRGRAVILFVLLAGVGVTLLDRSRSASRSRTRQKLVWRAVVLLPLGLVLQELDHGVAVILQDYALLFFVAIVAVVLSDRWLAIAAGIAFILGPAVHVAAEARWPDLVDGAPVALTDPIGEMVVGLVLTGTYPLVTYVAPLLLGMWLARFDLTAPAVQARLLAVTATVALVVLWGGVVLEGLTPAAAPQWWVLAVDTEPHSQSFIWLWQASAAAAAVLAVSLVLTEALPRVLLPLAALGQLALTVYVAHLLLMGFNQDLWRVADMAGAGIRVAGFTVAAAVFATAWRARFRRGPLEWAMDVPFALVSRRRSRAKDEQRPAPAEPDRERTP